MEFYECLVKIRKENGMTQDELAEKVGVSRQSVSKWELGESLPDIEKVACVADVFNVSLDTLCGRKLDSLSDNYSELFHQESVVKEKKYNNVIVFICSFVVAFAFCIAFFNLGITRGKNQVDELSNSANDKLSNSANDKLPETINVQLGSNEVVGLNVHKQSFVSSYTAEDAEYIISYDIRNKTSNEIIEQVSESCKYDMGKCYFTYTIKDDQKIDEIVFTIKLENESRNVIIMKDIDISGYALP